MVSLGEIDFECVGKTKEYLSLYARDPWEPWRYCMLRLEGMILSRLPELRIKKELDETTSKAPKTRSNFSGRMSSWGLLKQDVIDWYLSENIQRLFVRFHDVPADIHPNINEKHNSKATNQPVCQVGGEIILSSNFLNYALRPCLGAASKIYEDLSSSSQTLKVGEDTVPIDIEEWAFGDSFTIPMLKKVQGEEPDVVYKVGKDVRLVGELKFSVTVKLEDIIKKHRKKDQKPFNGLLGQIVGYMIQYGTKYGFLSTYHNTIFSMIEYTDEDETKPCLYFSSIFRHDQKIAIKADGDGNIDLVNSTVALRLVLMYFIHLCAGKEDWKLSQDMKKKTADWITKIYVASDVPTTMNPISTPYNPGRNRRGPELLRLTEVPQDPVIPPANVVESRPRPRRKNHASINPESSGLSGRRLFGPGMSKKSQSSGKVPMSPSPNSDDSMSSTTPQSGISGLATDISDLSLDAQESPLRGKSPPENTSTSAPRKEDSSLTPSFGDELEELAKDDGPAYNTRSKGNT